MKILHINYQQIRRYGHIRVSWEQKLGFGLVRNQHFVHSFSDRDVASLEAPLGIRELGHRKANRRLLETVEALAPDLIIMGHCDIISNQTVSTIRKMHPDCKIAYCNNDPLFVPRNVENIQARAEVADAIFVSTGKRELNLFEGKRARIYHMPNPVDAAIETLDNSLQADLPIDLLFCSNSDDFTSRLNMVKGLKDALRGKLHFKTFGSFGEAPVWGREYEQVLAQTKMGLNLNRQEGYHWYSSARMAQLAGNGILQFTHSSARFEELMPAESIVYFDNEQDLLSKIRAFHHDNSMRQAWASRARAFFHAEMNSQLYAQFIVEATMEMPFTHDYVWVVSPASKSNAPFGSTRVCSQ